LVKLEFELRALHLQSRYCITWATLPVHFALASLEIGSHELFSQSGLQLWSSWSQLLK
jgi:hypothetical protein